MSEPILSARQVHLAYGETPALCGASFAVSPGERVAVMGPSGSGKSSLLYCLAGIVRPVSGEVLFRGRRLDTMSEAQRSAVRLREIGVVFQHGDLVPELTLLENVMLPLQVLGTRKPDARARAMSLLERLGVAAGAAGRRAGEVSGGQAQRAAVARALVHGPSVILADEPTGSLDSVASELVLDALVTLTQESRASLVVVTHDHIVASHLDRHVTVTDGAVSGSRLAGAP